MLQILTSSLGQSPSHFTESHMAGVEEPDNYQYCHSNHEICSAHFIQRVVSSRGHFRAGVSVDTATILGNVVPWTPPARIHPVDAPPNAAPLVLLPGFGNCSKDYECPFGNPDDSVAAGLRVGAWIISRDLQSCWSQQRDMQERRQATCMPSGWTWALHNCQLTIF